MRTTTGERRSADAAGPILTWLAHPVTVVALATLVVNDHILKAAYPGWVTGKLSDVAGLVLAPPLLASVVALLAPRAPAGRTAGGALVAVGAGFVAVKTTPYAAAVASDAWSALAAPTLIRADPTDLLAVPALAVAWAVWRRASGRQAPPAGLVRAVRITVLLPAAALAVMATGPPRMPDAVAVAQWRGAIVVGQRDAYHGGPREADRWRLSEDGGRVWRYLSDVEEREFRADLSGMEIRARSGCAGDAPVGGGPCYRLVPRRMAVEESPDGGGSWRVAWQVPDGQREILASEYEGVGDPEANLSGVALVVADVPGGHVVVVANGRDGYARRDVDGSWQRIGFGAERASDGQVLPDDVPALPSDPTPSRMAALPAQVVLALALGCLLVVASAHAAASRARRHRWVAAMYGVLVLALPFLAMGLFADDALIAQFGALPGLLFAGAAGVGAVLVVTLTGVAGGRWAARALFAGLVAVILFLVPLFSWAAGVLPSYPLAVVLGLLGVAAAAVLAVAAGRRAEAAAPEPDPPIPAVQR